MEKKWDGRFIPLKIIDATLFSTFIIACFITLCHFRRLLLSEIFLFWAGIEISDITLLLGWFLVRMRNRKRPKRGKNPFIYTGMPCGFYRNDIFFSLMSFCSDMGDVKLSSLSYSVVYYLNFPYFEIFIPL